MNIKYFVLKPGGKSAYAKASRTAMRLFATEIEASDPKLANAVKSWAYDEERKIIVEGTHEAIG